MCSPVLPCSLPDSPYRYHPIPSQLNPLPLPFFRTTHTRSSPFRSLRTYSTDSVPFHSNALRHTYEFAPLRPTFCLHCMSCRSRTVRAVNIELERHILCLLAPLIATCHCELLRTSRDAPQNASCIALPLPLRLPRLHFTLSPTQLNSSHLSHLICLESQTSYQGGPYVTESDLCDDTFPLHSAFSLDMSSLSISTCILNGSCRLHVRVYATTSIYTVLLVCVYMLLLE